MSNCIEDCHKQDELSVRRLSAVVACRTRRTSRSSRPPARCADQRPQCAQAVLQHGMKQRADRKTTLSQVQKQANLPTNASYGCRADLTKPQSVVIQRGPCAGILSWKSSTTSANSRWPLLRGSDSDHLTDCVILSPCDFTVNRFSMSLKIEIDEISTSICLP